MSQNKPVYHKRITNGLLRFGHRLMAFKEYVIMFQPLSFPNPDAGITVSMKSGLHGDGLLTRLDGFKRHIDMSPLVLDTARAVVAGTERAIANDLGRRKGLMSEPFDLRHEAFGDPAGIKEKTKGDYVTQLDMELHHVLSALLRSVKNVPVISEEGQQQADIKTLPEAWILDPLDGTTAYLCGERSLCGPMAALLRHGEPVLSVMLNLDGSRLALAEQGRDSVMLRQDGVGCLSSGRFPQYGSLVDSTVLLNPQCEAARAHPQFQQLFSNLYREHCALAVETRVPHSMAALRMGEGQCRAVVHDNSAEFPKQMPWDVLPVKLWVEGRGGVFWGFDGLPYNIARPMPIVAATSAAIAEEVIALSNGPGVHEGKATWVRIKEIM